MTDRKASTLVTPFLQILLIVSLILVVGAPRARGAGPSNLVPNIIEGYVVLQRPNTPPPHSSWVVPLRITVHRPQKRPAIYIWETMTDEWGRFSFLASVRPGTYDVRVKSPHTLRNLKPEVVLTQGTNNLILGLLREGDANDDNKVTRKDLAVLLAAYLTREGNPEYTPNADFDRNGVINVRDFALLRSNYTQKGDILVPTQSQNTTVSKTQPLAARATVSQPISITITLEAGTQDVAGADVVLTFDPARVEIVDANGTPAETVVPGSALETVLANRVDRAACTITFSAGTLAAPLRGTHVLFSFRVRAQDSMPAQPVSFTYVDVVNAGGRSLRVHMADTRIQVQPLHTQYTPIMGYTPAPIDLR